MSTSAPIPIPLRERWRDARLRFVPLLIFGSALAALALVWKNYVAAPTLVGQAECVEANVSSYKPGMLAQLNVTRFQRVQAGDTVGQVLVTDPKILASSLAVIQAEIEMLRVGMRPIAAQQRTAMDYSQLRLDWMRQRAQLATARVNLHLAEAEFHRTEELFKDKIVSARVFEQAKGAQERLQKEVDELSRLVEEQAANFRELELTNTIELGKVSDEPLRAAIAAQESKLRLTEAELSPIELKASVDGTVNSIFHRSGEAITAGEPILTIAMRNSTRIIAYLRAPISEEPKAGAPVEVRTRGIHRQVGLASVLEVGSQFQNVAPALQGQLKLANLELGIPISISMPPDLQIHPGEVVDLIFRPKTD